MPGERLALARHTLARAETSTGLRVPSGSCAVMAPADEMSGEVLPAPDALRPLLRHGGIPRGTVVQVEGSTSLLLSLAASMAGAQRWSAVAALPDIGLAAAAEAGMDLGRTVVVPEPGPGAASVLGALVDGFDVLLLGPCRTLSERERREISTRVRHRGAVLLSGGPWPQAVMTLSVTGAAWAGAGRGDGLLRTREATIQAGGRAAASVRQARLRWEAGGLQAGSGAGERRSAECREPAGASAAELARAG